MFRIGEFSKLTQVSVRMLRYYDENGLLKPARIDPLTNYRLYSTAQIGQLKKIVFLRDLGFQVAEIAAAIQNWDDAFIEQCLDQKRSEIEQTIHEWQEKLQKIEQAKTDIRQEQIDMNYSVTIKSVPAYEVLSLRRVMPDYFGEGLLWKEMYGYTQTHRIPADEQTFTIYHDSEYPDEGIDMEICMPVARMGAAEAPFVYRQVEAVAIMGSIMINGPFENINGAYTAFAEWLQHHSQYRMQGESRQIVHRGPWNEVPPEQYLIEIQVPLSPR